MNILLKLLLGLSFGIAFAIGFFTKRFIFLILSMLFSVVIAAISLWFYLNVTPPDVGLGIIALLPVIIIVIGILHLGAALLGGIIGTIIGKKSAKKRLRITTKEKAADMKVHG